MGQKLTYMQWLQALVDEAKKKFPDRASEFTLDGLLALQKQTQDKPADQRYGFEGVALFPKAAAIR
jgi:hypothetical protein